MPKKPREKRSRPVPRPRGPEFEGLSSLELEELSQISDEQETEKQAAQLQAQHRSMEATLESELASWRTAMHAAVEAREAATQASVIINRVVSVDRDTSGFAESLTRSAGSATRDQVVRYAARVRWYVEQLPHIIDLLDEAAKQERDDSAAKLARRLLVSLGEVLQPLIDDTAANSTLSGALPRVWGAYQLLLVTDAIDLGTDIVARHQMVRDYYSSSDVLSSIGCEVESSRPRDLPDHRTSTRDAIVPSVTPQSPGSEGPSDAFASSLRETTAAWAAPHSPATRFSGARPDKTFNGGGAVLSSFRNEPSDARSLRVQPDGRIIVAGTVGSSRAKRPRRMAVARYLPDGRLDEAFGEGGWAILNIRGGDDRAYAAALQQHDGKIVIVGESLDPESKTVEFALIRLNHDGSVDKSFDGRGVALTGFGGALARAHGVAIDADRKIVAAGYMATGAVLTEGGEEVDQRVECQALARYEANGTLDKTFGKDGRLVIGSRAHPARAYALTIRSTGEIVAAGCTSDPEKHHMDFAVMRLNSDGTHDPSFGEGGRVSIDLGVDAVAHAVSVRDGKIVAAGAATDRAGKERHFALVRLNGNGERDETFNGDGTVLTTDVMGEVNGVAIEPDGAILVAGYQMVGDRARFALARYRSDGRLDSTFGRGGITTLNLGGIIARATDIVIDDEGRTLLAGTTHVSQAMAKFAVARLLVSSNDKDQPQRPSNNA